MADPQHVQQIRELIERRHHLREQLKKIEGPGAERATEVRDRVGILRHSFDTHRSSLRHRQACLDVIAQTGDDPSNLISLRPVPKTVIAYFPRSIRAAIIKYFAREHLKINSKDIAEFASVHDFAEDTLLTIEKDSIPDDGFIDPEKLDAALPLHLEIADTERQLEEICDAGIQESWHSVDGVLPPFLANWQTLRATGGARGFVENLERRVYACRTIINWNDLYWALPGKMSTNEGLWIDMSKQSKGVNSPALGLYIVETVQLANMATSLDKSVRPLIEPFPAVGPDLSSL